MSTLRVGTISNTGGTASTSSDNVINGCAKAWVNFNGTGTVAIRAGYNVSSITDNGTGSYTVNFTNALADANYSATMCFGGGGAQGGGAYGTVELPAAQVPTSSTIRMQCRDGGQAAFDYSYIYVSIFR